MEQSTPADLPFTFTVTADIWVETEAYERIWRLNELIITRWHVHTVVTECFKDDDAMQVNKKGEFNNKQ